MKKIIISTENTCDLTKEILFQRGIPTVDLTFYVDGKENGDSGDGKKMEFSEFYEAMRKGAMTKTSQVNTEEFESFFNELLKEGKDIVHISFASALSGTYEGAKKAAEKLNAENKNKIYVVDSLSQSGGQGLLVTLADIKAEEGATAEEVFDYAESLKNRICHYFVVDDLKYLARGGRVSKSTAFIGNILKIKPVLHTDEYGKLIPIQKVLSRKKSLKRLVEKMVERYNKESDLVYITHGDCIEDANYVADMIKDIFGIDALVLPLDFVIGSHSGPGTVALFFTADTRVEKK